MKRKSYTWQFIDRETLRKNPVVSMQGYGTFNMPAGTWSDDSSLTLCLLAEHSTLAEPPVTPTDILTTRIKYVKFNVNS